MNDTAIAGLIIALSIYSFPTIIAGLRGHGNLASIFVLNMFLGWSILGWIVALVWAISYNPKTRLDDSIYYPEQGRSRRQIREEQLLLPQTPSRSSNIPPQRANESDVDYLARLRRLREDSE